jgi:hypothetical protein
MISAPVIREIRRLLAEGLLSYRAIAGQVGVSRGTVLRVALKRRGDHEARRGPRIVPPTGPPERCPGCGALAQMPCLVCQLRAMEKAPRVRRD